LTSSIISTFAIVVTVIIIADVYLIRKKAQREVLTKEDGYRLANVLKIHLSEHGGTGLGVIGALAGAGLRLSGNDGQFMGNLGVEVNEEYKALQLYKHKKIDIIMSLDGKRLENDEVILFRLKVNTLLSGGKSVLFVTEEEIDEGKKIYKSCSKRQLRSLGDDINVL